MPARRHGRVRPESPLVLGVITTVVGVIIVAVAGDLIAIDPARIRVPRWMLAAVGTFFVLIGLVFVSSRPGMRAVLGAAGVSMFTVVLGWIAFGPGPRRFGGGFAIGPVGVGSSGEIFGRVLFGLMTVLIGALAVAYWVRWLREVTGHRH